MTKFLTSFIPNFLLQYFPADKILHFFVSFILLFLFFWIRKYFLKEEWFLRIFAFSFRDVIIIWIFKEFIDSLWFWNAEFMDFFADLSWIIFPIYIYFLIKLSSKLNNSEKLNLEKNFIFKYKNSKTIFSRIKNFIILSIIWFINIFYLLLKIPILALDETYKFIKKILLKL